MGYSTRVDYSKLVPPDTFIGRYMASMDKMETAYAYDFWTAVWALSVAVGRNVIVDRPRAPVYLNWYVLLVADSGITRKSTAVRRALRLVRVVLDEKTELIETKITPEALETRLHAATAEHGRANCVFCVSELVTAIGREHYAIQMPALLTDLYDCPALRTGGGTLVRGATYIREVYMSFLSASTPAWLIRAVNPDIIEGGFTSRCVFIVSNDRKRPIAWPEEETSSAEEHWFINDLRNMQEAAATVNSITLNDNALKAFRGWYDTRVNGSDPFRASFESREDDHVLRLAACLAINEDVWEIQQQHIIKAIQVISEVKEDGAAIFTMGQSSSQLVLGIDKVRDCLVAAGADGRSQSEITVAARAYIDGSTCRQVLKIMHELGLVKQYQLDAGVTGGRPAIYWKATASLMRRGAVDAITEQMEPVR